jgi:hypothetical protein
LGPLISLLSELQHKFSGFWIKSLPFFSENYHLSLKQVMTCYWAFVETEHLAKDHQVTKQPQLPIGLIL